MPHANIQGLDTLRVWKESIDFSVLIYREIIPLLPSQEKWNLADQRRRAATSIPANIAEGHWRRYYQENIHFCYMARGSLAEVYSHITLANRLGYLPAEKYEEVRDNIEQLIKLINGYITYLKRSRTGADEPGASLHSREEPAPYGFAGSEQLASSETN